MTNLSCIGTRNLFRIFKISRLRTRILGMQLRVSRGKSKQSTKTTAIFSTAGSPKAHKSLRNWTRSSPRKRWIRQPRARGGRRRVHREYARLTKFRTLPLWSRRTYFNPRRSIWFRIKATRVAISRLVRFRIKNSPILPMTTPIPSSTLHHTSKCWSRK